jgi:hypothetical protein
MAGKGEFQIGPGDTADCGMSTTVRKRNEGKTTSEVRTTEDNSNEILFPA